MYGMSGHLGTAMAFAGGLSSAVGILSAAAAAGALSAADTAADNSIHQSALTT